MFNTRRTHRILNSLLILALFLTVYLSASAQRPEPEREPLELALVEEKAIEVTHAAPSRVIGEIKGATGLAVYIIHFEEPALPAYTGGVPGLRATSPRVTGAAKLDAHSPDSVAYRNYLADQQARFISAMERALGHSVDVRFQYQVALNGMAVELTPEEAAEIAALKGVKAVVRNWVEYAQTDAGPAWIGAESIWDGSATGVPTMGEGIIVGVLDTGINMDHPSFADVGGDGYDHTNPRGQFYGWCNPDDPNYDPTLVCNDKLIGAWSGDADGPEDVNGHGSHTAGTAAGNVLEAEVNAPTTQLVTPISGVAPHANVIAYNIEGAPGGGSAPGDIIVAATEQAILDGVDVINYSFGGGGGDPWANALHWLNVRDAGIFVATSNGNDGPAPGTIGSPANAPWLLSVAYSSHDRAITNSLVDMENDAGPFADIVGVGFTAGYGPASIVYAGDYYNPNDPDGDPAQCMEPYPAGTFAGEIVVCDRGTIARVQKGANVLAGGAGGFVLANMAANGESIVGDAHFLPAVHIGYTDAEALRAWLASSTSHVATITGYEVNVDPANGDIMNAGSSRGPNFVPDILKPDVTAPGTGILAAVQTDNSENPPEYDFYSGSSMASPHAAGAGALLRSLYPDWTPAEIQSALMSTAYNGATVLKEDAATPADLFDMGAGRIDVSLAAQAALVLDETTTSFEAADPSLGGDPTTLNLASLADGACVQQCSWTRVLRNATDAEMAWTAVAEAPADMGLTVTPDNFTITAGGTQEIVVEADVTALPSDEWAFAQVTFSADSVPDIHFPVAALPTTGSLPDLVEINTRRDAGSHLVEGLQALEITELTVDAYGLVPGTLTYESLMEDSANGSPYDDLTDGVFYVTLESPAGAKRLLAEIIDSTAPDIDLFVGQDANGDGMPQEDEELCSSTTPSWKEYCEFADPAEGIYWVLVQSWAGSAEQPDDVVLVTAVVPGTDGGNMWVEGPASVPALEPFDVRVFWDTPMVAGERWYGAFALGTDAGNPGNIGMVPVNVVRHEDDVSKTVDAANAMPGDTLTFEIAIQPNVTPQDVTYYIQDTIPAGMTYVEGSATGGATVVDGVLTWEGVLPTPVGVVGGYEMSTSANDPACDTGFGGYVDLEGYGILAQEDITGDTVGFTAFSTGDPINYFGDAYTGMGFTDDGFAIFDFANYGGSPWVPQAIPDAELPNNVLAALWQDMEIFYDAGLNHGVSLATAGAPGGVVIVEYDDIQLWGGSAETWDFEIVVARAVDDTPGFYEIVYAYDNLSSVAGPLTIGVEDAAGGNGVALVNNGDATGVIEDGFMVCFDYTGPSFDPLVITYQATVDEGVSGVLTNNVIHSTDDPGSQEATASVDVVVVIPEDTMHVHRLRLSYRPQGNKHLIMGLVRILDQDHKGANEAAVSIMCTRPKGQPFGLEEVTNDQGVAWFDLLAPMAGDYECCVTDVVKDGWVYRPNQNVQTCETVTVP